MKYLTYKLERRVQSRNLIAMVCVFTLFTYQHPQTGKSEQVPTPANKFPALHSIRGLVRRLPTVKPSA